MNGKAKKVKRKKRVDKRYSLPTHILLLHVLLFMCAVILYFGNVVKPRAFITMAILYYIFMNFVFFLKIAKNKRLKESFRKGFIEVIVLTFMILFLMMVATAQRDNSNKINLNMHFKDYEFQIRFDGRDNIILNGLQYYYDFKSNKGHISFIISEINESIGTTEFAIDVPSEVEMIDLKIYNNSYELIEDKDFKKHNHSVRGRNIIVLEEFKKSLEGFNVNITTQGSLIPNGRFKFYIFTKYAYSSGQNSIIFNLGDYECKPYCYGAMVNSEAVINNNILKIKYPKDYYKDVNNTPKMLQQRFELNTYHLPTKTGKENLMNLYVSLIVASIVLLAELLRTFVKLLIHY